MKWKSRYTQIYYWNKQRLQLIPLSMELSCLAESADIHIRMFKAPAPTALKVSQTQGIARALISLTWGALKNSACGLLLEPSARFHSRRFIFRYWSTVVPVYYLNGGYRTMCGFRLRGLNTGQMFGWRNLWAIVLVSGKVETEACEGKRFDFSLCLTSSHTAGDRLSLA